jgi:hypothetical protein
MRWIWFGGLISIVGAGAALWPPPRRTAKQHVRSLPQTDDSIPQTIQRRAA